MSVVEIQKLTKRFERGNVVALQDIDLAIEPGEFVSLIGPSGCGKSTLLRIIGDLIKPTSGTVTVNGKPAPRARADHDYGIVFQDSVLFDWRTVARERRAAARAARLGSLAPQGARRRAARAGRASGVPRPQSVAALRRDADAGRDRARARVRPALLLMDEPFGALDEMTRERLNMELLRIWEASKSTVVFVTHSIAEAVFLSTRVVVMSARPGRVADIVEIDLPSPRGAQTREEPRYFELVTQVREALHLGAELDEAVAQ